MKTNVSSLLALLATILTGCATTQPLSPAEKTLTVVFDLKGIQKSELFVRANTWFVANFTNAQSVIQFTDKESGKIAGKYYSEFPVRLMFYGTKQMIEVDVRDEKARIIFSNPTRIYLGNAFGAKGPQPGFDWRDVYEKDLMDAITVEWKKLAASLESKLKVADTF